MFFQSTASEPSAIEQILAEERYRQWRKLILIPSESICVPQAAEMLATDFGNIYAEGYPEPILCPDPRQTAADSERFLAWQTRLSDRRFYKGCINTNRIELMAFWNIAQAFARLEGSPAVEDIYVNAQALSGAAANNAVYEAFVKHGDTVMGLALAHGGHLTHGSQYNFSGKTYNVVSYGIDPATRKLDYDAIRAQALKHRPSLIIGGASAYPWDFDWKALRSIADAVGAKLLADISHLAGMVVAGLLNNPLAHAHVVTTTTHKTLCGPRGAVIITTSADDARRINSAIFPGLQGGPHINAIAGIARLFELINTHRDEFVAHQKAVLSNTALLAKALTQRGFTLEYGGTNTHLLLIDLKKFATPGRPDVPVDGEMAGRLLELAGIVVNKNTLPGDADAGQSSGIRLGMPWLTQRGITPKQVEELADIIHSVLSQAHTTRVWVPGGQERCRGRIDPQVLAQAEKRTLAIAQGLSYPPQPAPPACAQCAPVGANAHVAYRLRGEKVASALQQLLTCNISELHTGDSRGGLMLKSDGSIIDAVVAVNLGREGRQQQFGLVVSHDHAPDVLRWLAAASDGYLLFDAGDLYAKIDGPLVIEPVALDSQPGIAEAAERAVALEACAHGNAAALLRSHADLFDLAKTFFIGQKALYDKAAPAAKHVYQSAVPELPLRQTVLNATHRTLGGKMVPFAGWDMPVQYPTGIFAEHRAVRIAAGVFDVSHMGVLEISGRHAVSFLEAVLANCVSRLDVGQAGYNYVLRPDGTAIDDTFLYRTGLDTFILVVNAANAEKVWDWFSAVNRQDVILDNDMPGKQIDGPVTLRNLRDAGPDSLLDLAVQGPLAAQLLKAVADSPRDAVAVDRLRMNNFVRIRAAGGSIMIARTGYTGEKVGFEVFAHPDHVVRLWNKLLETGRPWGVLPVGLGARDSLRTEAGFPLFGHELEGELGLSITEADYGFVPQFHVPFFVGRAPYIRRNEIRKRKLMRLHGSGRKSLRGGHVVLDDAGRAVGMVTSFVFLDDAMNFVVLACVDAGFNPQVGSAVRGYRASEAPDGGEVDDKKVVELTVMTRFPDECEKDSWAGHYAQ